MLELKLATAFDLIEEWRIPKSNHLPEFPSVRWLVHGRCGPGSRLALVSDCLFDKARNQVGFRGDFFCLLFCVADKRVKENERKENAVSKEESHHDIVWRHAVGPLLNSH
jgi:hypothetical protein